MLKWKASRTRSNFWRSLPRYTHHARFGRVSRRLALFAVGLVAALAYVGDAEAQLFGDRTLGGSVSRRSTLPSRTASPAPRAAEQLGSVDPSARYIRGNRSASDFVGTDSGKTQKFVGIQQADRDALVQSAVSDLRVETVDHANQRRGRLTTLRRTSYNAPRLAVGFAFTPRTLDQVRTDLARVLESTSHLDESNSISVSVKGTTAILRGEVASIRDRRLAGLLVLFEPGIGQVQNELTVRPGLPPPKMPEIPTTRSSTRP
jgi:hypothetical protein